jgi:putative peptidoglycan lipid II flippase
VVDLRHGGLALATSLSATVNLALLAVLLRRRIGSLGARAWLASAARAALASLVMVPPVLFLLGRIAWFDPSVPLVVRAAWLGAAVAAGALACGAAALLLGGPDAVAFRATLRRRLSRPARPA